MSPWTRAWIPGCTKRGEGGGGEGEGVSEGQAGVAQAGVATPELILFPPVNRRPSKCLCLRRRERGPAKEGAEETPYSLSFENNTTRV